MEKRILGKTGERLSVVGFGGIIVKDEETSNAARYVSMAVDRGINYFDVAPQYGNAQEKLGPALKPFRKDSFLACKTLERTKKKATSDLAGSLKLLKTDHLDLYQMHSVTTIEEVDRIMGPGGALEAFMEARDKGLIRYIGFSAHTEEAAIAMMDQFEFDTILFPFNWACWLKDGFGIKVLEKALEKQMGVLALKAMAKRTWNEGEKKAWPKCWYCPVDSYEEASMTLRFTLSKPVTAAVAPGHAELLWWACDAADNFGPITDRETEMLRERAEGLDSLTTVFEPARK